MFIHARIDGSFIDKVHDRERERLKTWLEQCGHNTLLLLELGAGYNTPVVIRMPMEHLAASLEPASFIRVNMESAQVPDALKHKSVSVQGDIRAFIEGIATM